jgi:hypothetical protein
MFAASVALRLERDRTDHPNWEGVAGYGRSHCLLFVARGVGGIFPVRGKMAAEVSGRKFFWSAKFFPPAVSLSETGREQRPQWIAPDGVRSQESFPNDIIADRSRLQDQGASAKAFGFSGNLKPT